MNSYGRGRILITLLYVFAISFLIIEVEMDIPDFMKQKTIRLYKFLGRCEGYEDAPMYMKDIRILFINRIYYISFKRVSKIDITDDLRLELVLTRCKGRESSDSCEKYQTIHVNHLCNILNSEGKAWSPIFKNAASPLGCPIKRGVTVVNNGSFDGEALSRFPVNGWVWKISALIYNERTKEVLSCAFIEAQVAPI